MTTAMVQKYVLRVECSKVKKKSFANRALYFILSVQWSDDTQTSIMRSYVAVFDFKNKIEGLNNSTSEGPPIKLELKELSWFQKSFFINDDRRKADRRKEIEDFFQTILSLPIEISRSKEIVEFFLFEWSPGGRQPANASIKLDPSKSMKVAPAVQPVSASTPLQLKPDPAVIQIVQTSRPGAYEEVTLVETSEYDQLELNPVKKVAVVRDARSDCADQTYWAVTSYTQRKSGEVSFEEGSVVNVMQCELSGWWFVQVEETKEQGWAPASCLLPANVNGSHDQPIPLSTGPLGELQTARDCEGCGPDELSFKAGERVEVLEANYDGWWKVKCNGKIGLVPSTFLEPIRKSTEARSSVYHHLSVYKKNTPPPRRNNSESVEELYAKVEEIQKKKKQQVQKTVPLTCEAKEDPNCYAEIPTTQDEIEPYEEVPCTGAADIFQKVPKPPLGATSAKSGHESTAKPDVPVSTKKGSTSSNDDDSPPTPLEIQKPHKPLPPLPSNDPRLSQEKPHKRTSPPLPPDAATTSPKSRRSPVGSLTSNSSGASGPGSPTGRVCPFSDVEHSAGSLATGPSSKQVVKLHEELENRVRKISTGVKPDATAIKALQGVEPKPPPSLQNGGTPPPRRTTPPSVPTRSTPVTPSKGPSSVAPSFSSSQTQSTTPSKPPQNKPPSETDSSKSAVHRTSPTSPLPSDATKPPPAMPLHPVDVARSALSGPKRGPEVARAVTVAAKLPPVLKPLPPQRPTNVAVGGTGVVQQTRSVARQQTVPSSPRDEHYTLRSEQAPVCSIRQIDRVACESLLLRSGQPRQFILRESTKSGHYAISMLSDDKVHHFPIQLTNDHQFYIGNYKFANLDEVIEYYQNSELFTNADGVGVLLGEPFEFT